VGPGRILAAILAMASAASCGRGPARGVPSGCRPDLRLVLGACVSPAIAAQICGAASFATLDGCAARETCEPGRARDLTTGECLPRREVRALASSLGILVNADETLVCPGGGELATGNIEEAAPRLGCLPPPDPRPRACPGGSIADASGTCLRFVEAERIDVVRWLHAAVGADGGAAAPPLCAALRRSVGALAVAGIADVRVEVALSFPDNDVSRVTARVRGSGARTVELEQVVAPMVEALRSAGGTASQTAISTAVACRRTSARPVALGAGASAYEGSGGDSQIR